MDQAVAKRLIRNKKRLMISELAESDDRQRIFVIQPNPPLAWSTLFRVFAAMAVFILGIGIACVMVGLPLVLPFAGAEVLVLGVAFYLSAVRGSVREVIRILDSAVIYEAGRATPVVTRTFQRQWTRVVLEQSHGDWYPGRLLLRSHGRQLELRRFLEEKERQHLGLQLQSALQRDVVKMHSYTNSISAERCRGLEHEA